jgi:SAM-dependent methyltransferase
MQMSGLKTTVIAGLRHAPRLVALAVNAVDVTLERAGFSEKKLRFQCNICGMVARYPYESIDREAPSCRSCGSSVRWRAMINALSLELFGRALAIPEFPHSPQLKGLGLSDWSGYARRLRRRMDYKNSYFEKPPLIDIVFERPRQLDIMNVDAAEHGRYDFILSSDVFEHVPPPALRAFANAYELLRPGGVLVFSVPYGPVGETIEHYPELHDFRLATVAGERVLQNVTRDGRKQTFRDLVFHGGYGATLEMRTFTLPGIERCLEEAGFRSHEICPDEARFGILWKEITCSRVMVARK